MLLTTTNDESKASGLYRVPFTAGAPEKIVMMDKALGAISKAKNADVVAFTASKFDEFPDYWLTDMAFSSPKKVTDANPQQAEYVWGKAENIKYINADGKVLTAMLIKPDNFDPTKKYPMMVYIYEELSQGLHGYRAPNVGTSIHTTRCNGLTATRPHLVRDRYLTKRAEARDPSDQRGRGAGLHRSEAHRIRALVGRLPDHLHDHADEHLRGRRSRRVGVEHDQRLRRPLGHGHCASSSKKTTASVKRSGTRRFSSLRTRRSSGSNASTRRI
jgi:hypothetical protein